MIGHEMTGDTVNEISAYSFGGQTVDLLISNRVILVYDDF